MCSGTPGFGSKAPHLRARIGGYKQQREIVHSGFQFADSLHLCHLPTTTSPAVNATHGDATGAGSAQARLSGAVAAPSRR